MTWLPAGVALAAVASLVAVLVLLVFGDRGPDGGDEPRVAATSTPVSTLSPTPTLASGTRTPTATAEASPTSAGAGPTLTPDLPDLVVSRVFAVDNRLVVELSNEGDGDLSGVLEVSINDGPRRRVDTGKSLRPGDRLEAQLDDEYIQRRSRISVEAFADPSLEELDSTNNRFEGVVEPDRPNDLEVRRLSNDPSDGHLVVTVGNNSPIPLVGSVTLAVRRQNPPELLRVLEAPLEVATGGEQDYDFPLLIDFAPADLQVILSSSAIIDADPSNDTFPR